MSLIPGEKNDQYTLNFARATESVVVTRVSVRRPALMMTPVVH
jgi:hypothetical protein